MPARTEEQRARKREYQEKYRKTLAGKESWKKYYSSEKYKATVKKSTSSAEYKLRRAEAQRKRYATPEYQEFIKKYRKSPISMEANRIKCRKLRIAKGEVYALNRALKRYGLTREKYDDMLASQHGVCAICGGSNGGKKLCIDHDHHTGAVRGFLCGRCNLIVGLCGDSFYFVDRLAEYVYNRV